MIKYNCFSITAMEQNSKNKFKSFSVVAKEHSSKKILKVHFSSKTTEIQPSLMHVMFQETLGKEPDF